jgi:hypothetical protein
MGAVIVVIIFAILIAMFWPVFGLLGRLLHTVMPWLLSAAGMSLLYSAAAKAPPPTWIGWYLIAFMAGLGLIWLMGRHRQVLAGAVDFNQLRNAKRMGKAGQRRKRKAKR